MCSTEPEKEQLIASIRRELLAQSGEASASFVGEFFASQRSGAGWRQALAELFANADEAALQDGDAVPTLELLLNEEADCLVVNCAQAAGFTSSDVRAVCALGSSAKRPVCGLWRGFGFRSVLEASSCPEIHSNGFHFGFDLSGQQPLSCLLPVWLGSSSRWARLFGDRGVSVVLPLRPEVRDSLLQLGGLASAVDPRWLLCAARLRRLVVNDAAASVWQSHEIRLLSNGRQVIIDGKTGDLEGRQEATSSERWIFVEGGDDGLQLAVPAAPKLVDQQDRPGGQLVAAAPGLPLLRGCGLRFVVCSPAGRLRLDSSRQHLLAASVSAENADLLTCRLPRLFATHAVAWPFDGPEAEAELAAYIAAVPLRREIGEPRLADELHRLLAASAWLPSDAGPAGGLHPPGRLLFDVPDAVRAAASARLRRHFLPACLERSGGGFSGHRGRELATCLGLKQFRLELFLEPLLADLKDRAADLTAADFGLLGYVINELCSDSRAAGAADPAEMLCRLPCLPCRCLGDPSQPLQLLQPDSGAAVLLPAASELPSMRMAAAALEPQYLVSAFVLSAEFLAAQSDQARHRLLHCLTERLGVLDCQALPDYLADCVILPLLQSLAGTRCSEASARRLALLTRCLMELAPSANLRLAGRVPLLTADSQALLPSDRHRLYLPACFRASPRLCLLAEGAAATPEFADWLPLYPVAYLQAAATTAASAWRDFFVGSLGVAAAPAAEELLRLLEDGVSAEARCSLLQFLAADWRAVKTNLPSDQLAVLLARLRQAAWVPASCCATGPAGAAYRPVELFAPGRPARRLLAGTPALVLRDLQLDCPDSDNGEAFYRDIGVVMDAREPAALRRLLARCDGLPMARLDSAALVRIYRLLAADCADDELGENAEAAATPILVPNRTSSLVECRPAADLFWSDLTPCELKAAPSWSRLRHQLQPRHLSLCYPPELRHFFTGVCGVPSGPLPLGHLAAALILAGELRDTELAWRVIAAIPDAPEVANLLNRLQTLRLLHAAPCLPCVGGGFCALQDAPILLAPAAEPPELDEAAASAEAALALAAAHPGLLRLVDASERCASAGRALRDFFKLPSPGRALEVTPIDVEGASAPPHWLVSRLDAELAAALAWTAAAYPAVHRGLLASACVTTGRVLGLAELPCLQLRFRLRSRPDLAVAAPVYEALASPTSSGRPAEAAAYVSSSVRRLLDTVAVRSVCRRLAARLLARLASQTVFVPPLPAAELAHFCRRLLCADWPDVVAANDGGEGDVAGRCGLSVAAVGLSATERGEDQAMPTLTDGPRDADPRVQAF